MKYFKEIFLALMPAYLLTLFLSSCSNNHEGPIIFLENGKMELGFDKNTGSFVVFRDIVNSHEFLDTTIAHGSLWEVDLLHGSEIETLDMTSSSKFHFSKHNNTLVLIWKDFSEIENKDLHIKAVVTIDEEKSLSSWKISVDGTQGKKVNRVVFPKITGIKDMGDEYMAIPLMMGELLKNPRARLSMITSKEKKIEWVYPGALSMQCLALYDTSKSVFYAACNDSLVYRKSFSFTLDSLNNLTYQMNNYPALDSTVNYYTTPYEAVIGSFKGDWITVAENYQEWGTKQKWCTESRFRNRLTPDWLEETALWIWNRGKSDNVLTPATDMKERLDLPVSVHWHWWHGCSYDDGFPEYFPPREGKESFIKALNSAQDKGIRAIVYMNQFLWGTSTESWKNENAPYNSVKNFSGNIEPRMYNIFTGKSMTYMCVTTQFWKDKYVALCDSAVNIYQTNGIYRDMSCGCKMCYDKNHGHDIGGGNYWFEHFSDLSSQIQSIISNNNQPITAGEGCGEAYLPYLDAFLTLRVSRERYAGIGPVTPIPFFQAVYHQYGIQYGNYSSLLIPPYDELWPMEFAPKDPFKLLSKDFKKQFLMEQARSFVWGMQPTISNYQSFLATQKKAEIDYLMDLAKVRYKGLKYLLYGKFMRSPDIIIPEEETNISRLSIYAGKRGESVTTFNKTVPLIYSGTWKSDDNQIGIALASISDNPLPANFSLNSNDYELPSSGEIYVIDIEGRKKISDYSNEKIEVNYMIPGKSLCIVELVPKK